MLFGLDKASQTTFLFLFTLLILFFIPLTYQNIKSEKLRKIENDNLLRDWHIWFVCIIYAVIFGFRYDYLNDWEQYTVFYEYVQDGGSNDGWREPGFYLFVKGLTLLGLNYYSLFVIECFFWIFSICYLFKDNRKYLALVLPFVFITTTDESLNVSRQYFAMSFLLIAYKDYWDGHKLRALLIALIAPMMHYSAVIWMIIYILLKRLDFVKPIWIVPSFLLVTVASSIFFDILASSTEAITTIFSYFFDNRIYDKSEMEALQSETAGANWRQMLTLGITRGIYIYLYYYYRKHNLLSNPILNNITLIGMLGIIVILLLGYNLIFSRIAAYIRIFYNIGWGVFAYIALFKSRHVVKPTVKILIFLVIFYLYGSFFTRIGDGFRSTIKDVNPYLIYDIKK